MPPDQGEKFYHEYCAFPEAHQHVFAPAAAPPLIRLARAAPAVAARSAFDDDDARRQAANASAQVAYRPPFAPHSSSQGQERIPGGSRWAEVAALARLQQRDWSCPTGTSSCAAIGFPNSCCSAGERCMQVADTGLGSVGCCPAGATCSGSVSKCAQGSTACASEIGGGCCIPGFVCEGVGCVQPAPSPSPSSSPPPAGPTTITSTSTSIISAPTPSTVVVTVVITRTPSTAPPATSTTTQTVSASPSSSPFSSQSSSDSSGAGAPYRPTSSPSDGSTDTNTFCPTGFYPCLASAGGGCCQTGRDCHTTSCPPVALTTIVNGGGVTVVVPANADATATAAAKCADGWFLCGADAGPVAGCCPSGYGCGTASCSSVAGTADAAGTASVAKALPGSNSAPSAAVAGAGGRALAVVVAMLAAGGLVAVPF
ncbi:hypothetical protein B0T26DRAFT_738787 [Lasiosphaeria miniovina]|uniref:GPI anchored protein n=1 Tax=Lasiosphaeria miniovina TaxID=1954250 RepID=A0AA40B663_9PEZI|nr:uncharacterized protein B0T26DRAFT_738787 [Lasiosphaeria miniovina]KAK0728446.1 hypothetical protein B0T26DRAFT_738787 [Lasiosphaeria miniovina]